MIFAIKIAIKTPQAESAVDIAEDLRRGLAENLPNGSEVLYLRVAPGVNDSTKELNL